jgi:hypothetical protein
MTGGIIYDPAASPTWGSTDVNVLDAWVGDSEIKWNQESNEYPVLRGYVNTRTSCRICQYDSDGNVVALRIKYSKTVDHVLESVTPGAIHNAPNTSPEDGIFTSGI